MRDVAYAHIQALEIPSASGRYCLIESDVHFSEVLKIVQQHYPTLHLPKKYGFFIFLHAHVGPAIWMAKFYNYLDYWEIVVLND